MSNVDTSLQAAKNLAKRGDFDHALGYVNQVLLDDPHNADAYFLQGGIYFKLGRPAQARESWQKVLDIDPSHPKARRWTGRLDQAEY